MSTVTVPRVDLTAEEVSRVLRDGLGDGYNVLPGMVMSRPAWAGPHEGPPNSILVGTGSNRAVKAQVTLVPRGGQTELRISPGGLLGDLIMNTFGIARQVRQVLASAPSLAAR
jgi:hypothetical protein